MKKNTFTATIASLLKNKNNSNPLKVSSLKSLLILLLFLVGIGNTISAQCIIGTGTTTTNGGGTGYSLTADPVECYYNFEHFQIVYTAAELSAGGMTSGAVINSMGFSISEVPGSVTLANYTIKMGHTNQLLASPAITSGLTTVKTAFTYTPTLKTAGNFDMITFSTNFSWNGTSNVVLDICTGSNAFTLPYGGLRYTAVATSPTYHLRQDNTTSCGVSVTTTANNRPNIRFNFTNPITYTSIVANGDWNTAATWSVSTGGNGVPTAGSNVIINTNVTAATTPTNQPLNITVNSGSTLTLNTAYTNPSGSTITVNSGGALALGGTLTNSGTVTVNGSAQINGGGYASGTAFSYAATGSALIMNHNSGLYGISTGQAFWPTANPPFNVTIQGTGAQINNTVGAVAGTLTVNSQLACAATPSVTVTGTAILAAQLSNTANGNFLSNGTLQINAGGYVSTSAPTYVAASTLVYNSGSTSGSPYGVSLEWTGSAAAAGVGIPNNVTIQGNTFITMPNGNRGMSGALNVTAGSGITLNGTSGDLGIGGNFTQNGTLTHSGRAINFFGTTTTTQTISGTGLNSTGATNCFAYFLNNTTNTGGVTIGVNATIDGASGNVLQLLNAGHLKIGAFTLTVNGNGGNILVSGASRVIDFTSASGILLIKGTGTLKTVTSASSGLLSITSSVAGGQVQVQGGGFDCGSALTTIQTGAFLTINTGGYVATNSPTYATGSTLSFRTGGAYGVGSGDKTWGIGTSGAGVPDKVEVNAASTNVTISEDRTARTSVTVTAGTLTNNTSTLSIATTVTTGATALNINGGTLTNGGGTINIGVANGGNQALSMTSGALTINSGTVNLNGNAVTSGGTFTMSNGNFNIDPNSGTLATSVASGTTIWTTGGPTYAVTGGTITFVDPPSAGTALTLSYSTTADYTWTGNTVIFGGSSGTNTTTSTVGFKVDTFVSSGRLFLNNVTINGGNTTDRYTSGPATTSDDFNIGGTLLVNTGSELRNITSGIISCSGDITNNGTFTSIGTMRFAKSSVSAGTIGQTVSGTGVWRNSTASSTASFTAVTTNNTSASGITLGSLTNPLSISGAFTNTAGLIFLGNNDFTFISGSTSFTGSVTQMFVTASGATGALKYVFPASAASRTFPVGENTGTTEYSPFSINFSANNTIRTIGVRAVDANHPNLNDVDTQTDYISRYWQVSNSAVGTYTYTATATYLPDDINGTEGNIKMNLWTGTSPWSLLTSTAASNVLTITSGVTNVSAPLGATADFTGRVKGSTTYTWNQTGSAAYTLDTNWTPARTVPAVNDILVFDGSSTPSPTVTGFASETIAKLLFTNSANVNLQPSGTATLTIAGGTGTDLDIPSGSTLNLSGGASVGLAFTGNTTTSIAGTLTFSSTVGTPTLNLTNTIATVTGTINLSSTTSPTITSTTGTLIFSNGSNCNMTTGSTIPIAAWGATSNLNISGIVDATTMTNPSQSFGNILYNCSGQTGTMSLFVGTTTSIQGNFEIRNTGSGKLRATTSGALTVGGNMIVSNTGNIDVTNNNGSVTVNGNFTHSSTGTTFIAFSNSSLGTLSISGDFNQSNGIIDLGNVSTTSSGTLKVGGTFNQSAGTLRYSGTATTALVEFNGSTSQSVTIAGSISNLINFKVSNPTGIAITGTLPVNNGATFTAASSGTAVTSGTVTYGTTTTLAYITAVGAQTTGSEFPSSSGPVNVTFNNTFATPEVTLSESRTVTGTLTITAGRVLLGNNDLTLANGGTQTVTTPGATKMIVTNGTGLYKRGIPATTGTYLFPIGDNNGSIHYSPVTLQFTANSTIRIVGAKVIDAASSNLNTGGTPTNYLSRYWTFSENAAGGTYNYYLNPAVATTGAEDENGTASLIKAAYWDGATWTTSTGSYTSGSLVSNATGVSETVAPLGTVEWTGRDAPPVSYTWVGFTDGSWNTATNWSPSGVPTSLDTVTLTNGSTGAAANLNLTTAVSVNNLTFNGSGNFFSVGASPAAITVLGNVTYTAGTGTWNATSTFAISSASSQMIPAFAYGNLTGTGGARVWSTGTTGIAGTFTPGAGAYTATAGSTVDYNGTGAQTIGSVNYYNLTNSGNGARTLVTGTIDVANSYTPTTATTTPGTANVFNFSSASAQTIPASSYARITNTGNGNRTLANSGTITIAGPLFTPGSGTYTVTGSTVALTSTTGFNLTLPTVSSGNSFNVLTINGTGGTFALPYAATTQNLANTLNIQAGTFVTNPTSNTTALVNNIAVGTINLSGGTLDDKSTGGGVVTTTNLLISTAWNQTGGLATVNGDGLAKLIFTGGGATSYTGLTPNTNIIYYLVQVSDNTTLSLASNLAINGIDGGATITLDAGSTIDANTFVLSTSGTINTFLINGTFKTSNTNGFSGSTTTALNNITNTPTITLGANSTVEYTNASATQTVTNRTDYANLTLTGLSKTIGATALTLTKNLTINSGATYNGAVNPALTIGGNFLNSGTFTQGTGLLTFNGTATQTVGGTTASTFNNVTVSGAAGGLSLGNSQTINGTLTLSASSGGNIDLNGSNNITLGATASITGETCSRQFINSGLPTQGNGYVQTTRTLAANPGNVANLGLNVQTATAMGSTNIKRFVKKGVSSVGNTNSINRVYSITPTTVATGNVTLTSSYCDGELNGNTESTPALVTFYGTGTDETTGYSDIYGTASNDASGNTVTTIATASLIAGQNNITLANAGPDAYYTVQDGDWNTAATWVLNAVPPAGVPTIIKNLVTVNGTVTNAPSSITINSAKSLTFGASGTITTTNLTNNGSVVMTSGGTLTIASGGTFANGTNTFTGGSGTVIFAGTGTITGTTTFNNVTLNNGVNFGTTSTIGATGTLQLNSVGFASNSNSPLFASGSTLKYNAGGGSGSKYNQSFEWPVTNGPSNVVIDNNSWVQLTANRSLAGNLTVTNGALQSLGANTLTLNGTSQTATISESSGGAIYGTDNGFGNDLSLVISSGTTTLTGDATSSLDDAKKFINVTVNSGATLALSRGILCKYGAFALNGTLQINANGYVQNDTSYGSNAKLPAYNSTTGALIYNNGGPYTNGGEWLSTNSPFNVTIQNNSAVVLSDDRTINGTLTLTAGTLELGTKNLTIGATGTITASSPSASTMIIASGSGQLRKSFSTTGSFTYPIGDNTGTAEYSPVTLNFTAGTLAGYAGVNVTNAKQTNNTSTTDYINRYWTVATSGITSPTCTASFVYLDADIVGTESNLYGGRYLSSTWNCMDAVTTATNTISKVITAFGDFTAGEASVFGCCVNPTSGGTIAVAQTICSGTAPTAFTSSALPSGQSGTLEYKWQSSTTSSSSGFSDISGATATTYSPGILTATTWFKRLSKVTCSDTWSANSNVVTITVNSLPTVSIASNNSPVCSGAASFSLTGTTDAVVTYNINGGTNATTTLTGGAATISVPNPFASQVLTLVSVANNGCTSSLSDTSTVSVSTTTYDGTSWSNGNPDSSKLAIFTGNYTIAADLTACSLRVTNNAVVTVNSNYNVYLNGAITVDSGSSFTMNNNTNLLQSDASAVNTGNIIVKRNTSTIVRLDHTLWSSPVTGQNLFSFSPNTLVNRFYVYNTATNSYVTTGLSNTSLFTPAKGFAVRAPNNQSATTPAVWTGTFTGVPNNGTKTFTLATNAANGYNYNLVGNPYPSAISASNFYAANASKIGGTLYFYAHTLTMNSSGVFPTGTNYATWTGLGGTAATEGDGHTPAVAPNGIIQVGQGFIVRATASGDVTFTNAMRVANQQDQFMKAATASAETHRMWLNLKTDTGVDVNQILVGYMDGATQGVDAGLDGLSFGNTGSYLYSKIENDNFVIQARSLPFDVTDEVPLGFNCATAGSYSISLTNTDGLFAADQDILVRDNLTGTDTSIKTVPYTFNSETGVFDTRFRLVYTQALGVPSTNFTENSVIVYKNTDWFHVNTKGIEMKDIMVYDISGRLIYSKKDINATTAVLNGLTTTNQVLILKINSIEDKTVTIKVIN